MVVILGILLAFFNDKYRIVETVISQIIPYEPSSGGEVCLMDMKDRGIQFTSLGSIGKDVCIIEDAVKIRNFPNTKMSNSITLNCNTALKLADWFEEIKATEINHMGTYNCRKISGKDVWSQHSFGAAVDIASINGASVKKDWYKDDSKGEYLRDAGEKACSHFSNVLTPDFNAAHQDHFHLDTGPKYNSCDPTWFIFMKHQVQKIFNYFGSDGKVVSIKKSEPKSYKDVLASLPECEGSPLQIKFFELTESERKIEQQKEKITDTWTECRGTKNTIEWSGYSGGWLNGKRHYGGTYWNADGETYSGGFKNGERHGFGVQQSQGGILMEGQFKDGQFKEEPWWKLW